MSKDDMVVGHYAVHLDTGGAGVTDSRKQAFVALTPTTEISLREERDRYARALRRQAMENAKRMAAFYAHEVCMSIPGTMRAINRDAMSWWAAQYQRLRDRASRGWSACPSVVAREAKADCLKCGGVGLMPVHDEDGVMLDPLVWQPCPACGGSGKEHA